MDAIKVGQSIALLRKKYGMTQLELAERLSVTDKAVSRWERGIGTPDTSLLVKLSLILDIDIETLLEGNVSVDDLGWKGVLILSYPEYILPTDLVYTKRIIYLQLGYFLLTGITDVLIVGDEVNIRMVRELVTKISGLKIEYDISNVNEYQSNKKVQDYNQNDGVLMITGVDLFYGKDFTKCLRRIMNNSRKQTKIHTFEGKTTNLTFYPRGLLAKNENAVADRYLLERGVLHLPVRNHNELMDAGTFVRILEANQDELFMDLNQIMERRHAI